MAEIFKVKLEDDQGNVIYFHTDSSIVGLDSTGMLNLKATTMQEAVKLMNEKIESKCSKSVLTATVTTSFSGSNAPFQQVIPLSGVKASDTPIVGPVLSDNVSTASAQLEAFALITRITTQDNQITVFCYDDKPEVAVPIQLYLMR